MKEVINRYKMVGSKVYLCFLDAPKAFDRVNCLTFKKLEFQAILSDHYCLSVVNGEVL